MLKLLERFYETFRERARERETPINKKTDNGKTKREANEPYLSVRCNIQLEEEKIEKIEETKIIEVSDLLLGSSSMMQLLEIDLG
jgi:hypothetical protein